MKKIISIFLLLVSMSATAEKWHTGEIKMIYPLNNGGFVLTFKNHPQECASPSQYFYTKVGERGITNEGANNIYSLALMAATSGKEVAINYDDTSESCFINRAYVVF